ncbi:MAG: hypothetical protein ACRDPY_00280 [Streptosporangiaceae bacterium]
MTESDAEDLTAELLMQVFQAVQEYVAGSEVKAVSAAHQVSKAMDLGLAEVAAAVQKLKERGWVSVGGHVIVGPHKSVEASAVLSAHKVYLSEGAIVLPLEGIGELAAKTSGTGIAGLSALQLFTLILLWLLAVGMPVAQQALPPEARTILSDEYGTIGLAVAITSVILAHKRR